jgi:ethanolamine utilization protein EutP (predicted NTPase)
MLNKTGLILKIKDDIAFVISKDCMYYQIKSKPDMLKGQTVEFNQSDIIDNRSFLKKQYNLIATAAAVLIIMVSIIVYINSALTLKTKFMPLLISI